MSVGCVECTVYSLTLKPAAGQYRSYYSAVIKQATLARSVEGYTNCILQKVFPTSSVQELSRHSAPYCSHRRVVQFSRLREFNSDSAAFREKKKKVTKTITAVYCMTTIL